MKILASALRITANQILYGKISKKILHRIKAAWDESISNIKKNDTYSGMTILRICICGESLTPYTP